MNRPRLILPLVLVALLAGCQHTPLQQVEDERAVFVEAKHTINQLHRMGIVTVEDKVRMKPTTQAIRDGIDSAEEAAIADESTWRTQLDGVRRSMNSWLVQYNIDPKTGKQKAK
jgi:hypothetical protein